MSTNIMKYTGPGTKPYCFLSVIILALCLFFTFVPYAQSADSFYDFIKNRHGNKLGLLYLESGTEISGSLAQHKQYKTLLFVSCDGSQVFPDENKFRRTEYDCRGNYADWPDNLVDHIIQSSGSKVVLTGAPSDCGACMESPFAAFDVPAGASVDSSILSTVTSAINLTAPVTVINSGGSPSPATPIAPRTPGSLDASRIIPSRTSTRYVGGSPTFITIGTGGVTGMYYPSGNAICRLVNSSRKMHGVRCSAESTGGSVYNLNAIAAGELDMGMAQSDWQYHAYNGTNRFKDKGANKDLRAVFSLHPQPFTVVARADSGIRKFADLKGKRVNIGNPGSSQRGTMEVVMEAFGWSKDDFKLALELKSAEQSWALCDNKIDAMVFTVGHPSGSIKEATTSCNSVLVRVSGPKIDKLVFNRAYYRTATTPGGMYRGTPRDTKTFGVGATLVTSSRVSDNVVYNIVKAVFDNFDQYKKLHPAFKNLKKAEMIKDGLSVPLHNGAKRYYMEAGLM